MKLHKNYNFNIKTSIFQIILIILIVSIVINPATAINSAKNGLSLWFNVLLPSLLPFLILSQLFITSGFVEFFGKLLGPIMRPIFNVSGLGAFPLLISIVSGYPIGAKITSDLRHSNLINKIEGNRLITFTSTSGPLFILGSILIGMLNLPQFSLLMMLPHYLGILTVGIIFRFYKNSSFKYDSHINRDSHLKSQISPNNDSIGKNISTSVQEGINSILLIGGFVIMYNVIIDLLLMSGLVSKTILSISNYTGINPQIIEGVVAGFIELTTGCKKISTININPIYKIMVLNFLIAWGGLSILSQAISFISQTDISVPLYLFSKFLHGVFSFLYTYLIYILGYKATVIPSSVDVFILENEYNLYEWLHTFLGSTKLSIAICVYFIVLSLFVHQIWIKEV